MLAIRFINTINTIFNILTMQLLNYQESYLVNILILLEKV